MNLGDKEPVSGMVAWDLVSRWCFQTLKRSVDRISLPGPVSMFGFSVLSLQASQHLPTTLPPINGDHGLGIQFSDRP